MNRNKRIVFVAIGIAFLVGAAILLINFTKKTSYEEYVNSLEEKEIATISLQQGDILIVQTEKLKDIINEIKIYDDNDDVIASSRSELSEGVSLIFTAEESGEYKIVAILDNPDNEVDGTLTITVQNYSIMYLLLLGSLFIFATILIISSSLLREHYIIPADVLKEKKKFGAITSAKEEHISSKELKKELPSQATGLIKDEIKKKYKTLIQPVGEDVIKSFIGRVYNGISARTDIIGGYAIDLKVDTIIWRLSDQKEKKEKEIELLKTPIALKTNEGLNAIFEKIIDFYGGILPAEIVLSFPNYFLNGLVHKQVLVLILLKPDIDWGISSAIFKKQTGGQE